MASVTFPPALGGDGSTVTDDANPSTGLSNGGHRSRFVPSLAQAVAVMVGAVAQAAAHVASALGYANNASGSAAAAAASAASAVNSPGTNATSTTSTLIGTGSKAITVQTGKLFVVGQPVMVARTSTPGTTWMAGNVTSYDSGTGALVVNVVWTAGSGTFTDWTVSLAGPANPAAINKAGDTGIGALTMSALTVTGLMDYDDTVVVINTNTTAVKSRTYVLTASLVLTLPVTPAAGDWVRFKNKSGVVTCSIGRNGQNIESLAEDMTLSDMHAGNTLVFADATRGWVLV